MAEHIQQEAITREGPLYSKELFHLLKTVIQDEAPNHAMQFAQRLRDTADEELVAPLENFVAAAYREPDLPEELGRADEAAEAEVDEETPSPSQQRQLLRAHVNLVSFATWSLPSGCCQMGKTLIQMSRVRSSTDAENSASSSLAEMLPFQSSLWHRHDGSSESVGSRKPNPNFARHLSWDMLPPGSTQAGHDSYRDLSNIATVSGSNTMMQWNFGSWTKAPNLVPTFNSSANSRCILLVVTDLETPWQTSVVERHGDLFKMAFEKACSMEAATTEAEVNELIDFTFAELNR